MKGLKVFVHNMPVGQCERYVVARVEKGELWYWGSWRSQKKAYEVAEVVDGVVCEYVEDAG